MNRKQLLIFINLQPSFVVGDDNYPMSIVSPSAYRSACLIETVMMKIVRYQHYHYYYYSKESAENGRKYMYTCSCRTQQA